MFGCLVGGKLWSVDVRDDVPCFVFTAEDRDGNVRSADHATAGAEVVPGAAIDSPGPVFFLAPRDGYLTAVESVGFIILVDVESAD